MFAPLLLKDARPLVQGSRRLVFRHPQDDGLLVKVLKSEAGGEVSLPGLPWLRLRRPNEMVRLHLRELGEFLRVRSHIPAGPLPIAGVFGMVDTDLGIGLVVEKIAGEGGGLAPSLRTHVEERGLDRGLEARIVALRDEVIRCGIVAGDANTRNIVVGASPDGFGRLVIVDGTGDKTFVPVNSMSAWLNRRSLMRRFDRLLARLRQVDAARAR